MWNLRTNTLPKFQFVFREISRNWRKISRNSKLIISWNFRENTKTKFVAATLIISNDDIQRKLPRGTVKWCILEPWLATISTFLVWSADVMPSLGIFGIICIGRFAQILHTSCGMSANFKIYFMLAAQHMLNWTLCVLRMRKWTLFLLRMRNCTYPCSVHVKIDFTLAAHAQMDFMLAAHAQMEFLPGAHAQMDFMIAAHASISQLLKKRSAYSTCEFVWRSAVWHAIIHDLRSVKLRT